MNNLTFDKEYRVHVYETGPDGKLNLCSLFNYLQDIASDHAVRLGFGRDDLMRDNRFWVLSRMYAEINQWPVWEETISVKTWPNGTDKLFALRNYDVKHTDGRHIAAGISSWLILDRTTKKVQRPDSVLSEYNASLIKDASPIRQAEKLEAASENFESSPVFRVKVSDLDVNRHTNNVNYLKWVSDLYDLEFATKFTPVSAEINYLAESVFNDEIFIKTSVGKSGGTFYNHSILRTSDNKELCRIRIGWKEVKNK
jgi:medium-chain acyl-[acyl-carrier-protein] hydrolase